MIMQNALEPRQINMSLPEFGWEFTVKVAYKTGRFLLKSWSADLGMPFQDFLLAIVPECTSLFKVMQKKIQSFLLCCRTSNEHSFKAVYMKYCIQSV